MQCKLVKKSSFYTSVDYDADQQDTYYQSIDGEKRRASVKNNLLQVLNIHLFRQSKELPTPKSFINGELANGEHNGNGIRSIVKVYLNTQSVVFTD